MFFITKPVTIDLIIFIEKYRKKTPLLNEEVPSQFAEKEFGLIKRKTVIQKKCYLLSDLVT